MLHLAKRAISRRGGVVVLTLHRVLPHAALTKTSSLPGMAVSQSTFAAFLRHLSQYFEVINLRNTNRSSLFDRNRLKIAITFDDGWKDNYDLARPIARVNNIPFTIFICPLKMGMKSPFWPETIVGMLRDIEITGTSCLMNLPLADDNMVGVEKEEYFLANPERVVGILKTFAPEKRDEFIRSLESAAKKFPSQETPSYPDETMSWSQAAELSSGDVTFGSHTQNHSILTTLTLGQVSRELSDSKQEIEKQLGEQCETFAYPNGNCDREIRNAVEAAGYSLAFTTRPGFWTKDCDSYLIPRINIWEGSLVNPAGSFSKIVFEYCVFWRALLASKKGKA